MTEQSPRYLSSDPTTPAEHLSYMLKQTRESSDFQGRIERAGLNLEQTRNIIVTEQLSPPLEWMLLHPKRFTPQLALIMSMINVQEVPNTDLSRLQASEITHDITLLPFHNRWNLCAAAEPRLLVATDTKRATTIVDQEKDTPYMVIKDHGLLAGLCTQTVQTPKGNIMMEGCFYAPVDTDTRKNIKEAIKNNQKEIAPAIGTWAYMRQLHKYGDYPHDQVLRLAKTFADNK